MAAMFFWAGYDTSGVTMTWTIFLISQHVEVEAKVVEELCSHGLLATPDQPVPHAPCYEDISKLRHLSMVLREAQRLYPAVSGGSARRCDTYDTWLTSPTLGKFCVPKGVSVWMITHALHNTSHNWSHPDKFDPSRWQERLAEYAPASAAGIFQCPMGSSGVRSAEMSSAQAQALAGPDEDHNQHGCPMGSAAVPSQTAVPAKARRYMPVMDGQRDCIGQSLTNATVLSTLAQLYGSFLFRLADEMGGAAAGEHLKLGVVSPERYGGVFHSRVLWAQVVVISDPYVVAQVLSNSRFDKLDNCGYESSDLMMSDHGGLTPNLVSSQTDDYWRAVRKAVSPAFASSHVRERFADVSKIGSDLVTVLHTQKPNESADIYRALLCLSVDVIGQFGFNYDLKAVETFGQGGATPAFLQSILDATIEAEQYLIQPWRRFVGFLPSVRKGKEKFEVFKSFIRTLLQEVKARGSPAPADQTIAANLLRCKDPATDGPLTDAQLLPMAAMFFWAGYDTSGVTMTWTIFLLSQHPEVEAKVVEELHQQGLLATPEQPAPRALCYEDLSKLPYLSMVLREAQRLYPAVSGGSARRCDTHDNWLTSPTLGRFCVPKGVSVWMITHALHNTSHNWSHPDKFDPSRWQERLAEYAPALAARESSAPSSGMRSAETSSAQAQGPDEDPIQQECPMGSAAMNNQTAVPAKARRYMPFMDGQRDCIGQSLANVTAMSTLARLYGSFSFRLADEMGGAAGVRADEHLNLGIISPAHGLQVN
ncbi:hypothetical protein WJX84_001364 [Apatococcus fuscideae]|uniref:Cytochrome P450 n=1 Tax=Apatococcus fuscideae TaxID=2026836 RepID=A0AAW1ST30_9CHLO